MLQVHGVAGLGSVATVVGLQVGRPIDYSKGAAPNCSCLCSVGAAAGPYVCELPVRQPGGCGLPSVSHNTGEALHAYVADTGLRGARHAFSLCAEYINSKAKRMICLAIT